MKPFALLALVAGSTLGGAETVLPDFNSNKIETPPLSLRDTTRPAAKPPTFAAPLPRFDEPAQGGLLGANPRATLGKIVPAKPRLAPNSGPGQMPVLEPNPNIDHKIVLKEPDPRIDFKMLIRPSQPPEVARK